MSDIVLKVAPECPRCLAPWAAATTVNRELPDREVVTNMNLAVKTTETWDAIKQLQQVATPSVRYICGSVFHDDDHADFDVPEQEYQSPACLKAELARHRGS